MPIYNELKVTCAKGSWSAELLYWYGVGVLDLSHDETAVQPSYAVHLSEYPQHELLVFFHAGHINFQEEVVVP